MAASTLSPSWNRVARLAPTLSPRVELRRQIFRGELWFVAHDPVSNEFFRLNPVLHHLVGLLDGKRMVDDVWQLTLDRFGDDAPTQNEVIGVLAQLYSSNLLHMDLPADAESLLTRKRHRRLQHWRGQAASILFFRFPLFNPDNLLRWLLPIFRPLLSKWGLLLWVLWLGYAFWQFLPDVDRFINAVDSVLAPANWGWLIVLFLVTKAIHELGHGLVCRRFGGVVPEIGIIILVLFPAPYVDATSSWNFPDRSKRLLVAAAGMIFELAVAAAAALTWLGASPGSLVQQLAYNMIFLASVSTLLFNGNPLLRFDAYYMLSDLLGVANLYERGTRQWQWLMQRFVFGMTNLPPIAASLGERFWLTSYGVASTLYRFLVLFGIFTFIIGKLFVVGVLLGLWSAVAWILVPAGRYVRWLAASPALTGHRVRALTATAGLVAFVTATIGLIPMKYHHRAPGIVESSHVADIVPQINGFVTEVLVDPDEHVRRGDVILTMDNPELRTEYSILRSQDEALQQDFDRSVLYGPSARAAVENRKTFHREQLAVLERRIDRLTIRSPLDGVVVGVDLDQLVGRYVERGELIGKVVDPHRLRITALVGQDHSAPLFGGAQIEPTVHLRTFGTPSVVLETHVMRTFDAGHKRLPHPALGFGGGGPIATDQSDRQGLATLRPHFELWLALPDPPDDSAGDQKGPAMPGQRVHVRFTLMRRTPLLQQWLIRLRQIVRARVSV